MKKALTVVAVLATLATAAPASARDCGCNPQRGRGPLISADVNVGGRGGLVDVDANVGGRNNYGYGYGHRGGGLIDLNANVGGRNGLLDLNADVGGHRNGLLNLDVNILGGGGVGGH